MELATAPETTEQPPEDLTLTEEMKELTDFDTAKTKLQSLVNDWKHIANQCEINRLTRDIKIDVQELRDRGELDADETMIPVRVIETNIRREQPSFINFIKGSRRISIFRCITDPHMNCERLEAEFTAGMTYSGWEIPFMKEIDGTMTHGSDAVEVVFDPSKPLHVGIEHIGKDKLFYPLDTINLQDAPMLIREYTPTYNKLKSWVQKYDFDKTQVDKILEELKKGGNNYKKNSTCKIYKKLCKYDDVVYVSWFSLELGVTDWLSAPAPLFLGEQEEIEVEGAPIAQVDPMTGAQVLVPQTMMETRDIPVTRYPIFQLPYMVTEKPKLLDVEGRVYLDKDKQEAQTSVTSGYVNGVNRAMNVYASPKQDLGNSGGAPRQSDLKLANGTIINQPMDFWSMPAPDPSILRAIQYLDVANSQEVGQVNFAAQNRQDSRKTAAEINTANQQSSLLSSAQVTVLSIHLREVYSLVWRIVQSQARMNKITFLVDSETGYNNMELLSHEYEVRPSGDTDVIQRAELLAQMRQDWPVVSATVIANQFLADFMRLAYSDKGEKYAEALLAAGDITGLLREVSTMLAGSLSPEEVAALSDQEKQYLMDLQQRVQAVIGSSTAPSGQGAQSQLSKQ